MSNESLRNRNDREAFELSKLTESRVRGDKLVELLKKKMSRNRRFS
jgi:hypothetical protein